jgi:hypothetical protein
VHHDCRFSLFGLPLVLLTVFEGFRFVKRYWLMGQRVTRRRTLWHFELTCFLLDDIVRFMPMDQTLIPNQDAADRIQEAINRQSLSIMHRICLVLDALETSTDAALASWSTATKENIIGPALA